MPDASFSSTREHLVDNSSFGKADRDPAQESFLVSGNTRPGIYRLAFLYVGRFGYGFFCCYGHDLPIEHEKQVFSL